MSRKNTILIAVLINAGLLIVLFVSALKSSREEQEMASNVSSPSITTIADVQVQQDAPVVLGDEVDLVLSQFPQTTEASTSNTNPQQGIEAAQSVVADATPNFAQELSAVALPESAPAPSSGTSVVTFKEVVVKKGDVLEKIARLNKTSVEEIMKCNNLSNTRLKIGQNLKIPSKTGSKADQSKSVASSTKAVGLKDSSAKYYTVKNGDNPWTIAVKNRMKVEELLKLNHLDAEKARRLKPGDQLLIR